ncbi:MAG: hypothetical protein MUO53_06915 [Maribacter sp.]|nr:hypothetical protein [Maribacter sp.]
MKKIYYLSTCSTCQRILKELQPLNGVELQDIKTDATTPSQLTQMKELAGSYEALFSRRALLYKERGLNAKILTESEYKELLLDHYTFLKRPVILINGHIFIGNTRKVVDAAQKALHP